VLAFIAVLALCLQMIAPYLVWRSRWNVPAHINLGFCVTAYVVPGLLTDVWSQTTPRIVDLYTTINAIGAVALVIGLLLGAQIKPAASIRRYLLPIFDTSADQRRQLASRVESITMIGIVGMVLAYLIMGFVPMFADDPLTAKQFKGEYFEPYYRAAYLFRFSFSTLVACLPIVLTNWWAAGHRKSLLLGLSAAVLITVSLARASSAMGIITFIGFLAARRSNWTRYYLIFVAIIFPLGSAGYLLLGILTGIESLTSVYSVDSVFDIVASGAPDIVDQLLFLEGFYDLNYFTYGRTFFGGLIPGNYMWNPSVWTLTYDMLGADISETVSGGLRLSVALWGYTSFGWVGVALVPMFSGMINGHLIRILRSLPLRESLLGSALVLTLYMTLGKQLTEFYFLSIHSLPSIACAWLLCFGYKKLKPGRQIHMDANASTRTTSLT
jgi:hypothetical protein